MYLGDVLNLFTTAEHKYVFYNGESVEVNDIISTDTLAPPAHSFSERPVTSSDIFLFLVYQLTYFVTVVSRRRYSAIEASTFLAELILSFRPYC